MRKKRKKRKKRENCSKEEMNPKCNQENERKKSGRAGGSGKG